MFYSMAIFMNENSHDAFPYLQEAARLSLRQMKKEGYADEVELMSGECPSCQELKDKVYTINDALKQMPVPNMSCTFILTDKNRGFCRCMYLPSLKEARESRKEYKST